MWDEEKISQEFPDGFENQYQYENMPELNGKCDIARWEILNKYVGFFVDADAVCINKIDDYMLQNIFFASYGNEIARPGLIATYYTGAKPDNLLLKAIINEIGNKIGPSLWRGTPSAWNTVGPVLLTSMVTQMKYTELAIYPSFYFIPKHFSGIEYTGSAKVYATQYWGITVNSVFDYNDVAFVKL